MSPTKNDFFINVKDPIKHRFDKDGTAFEPEDLLDAAIQTNDTIGKLNVSFLKQANVELFDVIDKKQASAFVGAIFIRKVSDSIDYLGKNPSQTGHPDLVPAKYLKSKSEQWKQTFWDQFPHGGVEVKASCGNLENGVTHELPVGAQRMNNITGVCWKGHHDKINNLLGLFWDFIEKSPKILAAFYANDLVPSDFTNTVPRVGGGHTTNVCITKASATKKLGKGWVFCIKEKKYSDFFSHKFQVKF
ncbi:Uncharacterised protein [uncultured archaeon]|nr:Uncharacterised protein [uncultured archaeon]